jgi:hypothetical protein
MCTDECCDSWGSDTDSADSLKGNLISGGRSSRVVIGAVTETGCGVMQGKQFSRKAVVAVLDVAETEDNE